MARLGIFLAIVWAMVCLPAMAQVKTDGSLGPRQSLSGPNFNIVPSLGRQVGPNLFHSFSDFNLAKGQTATFSGPGSVQNVLARVTGGSSSSINGTLRCDIAGANLYLMNPAGVVFGHNAALDVKGSFAVTSADFIRLGKSGQFSAAAAKENVLTTAAPAAFGFLGPRSGGILVNSSQLAVGSGKTLTMAANGDILLNSATLGAPAGRINVMAGAGRIELRRSANINGDADGIDRGTNIHLVAGELVVRDKGTSIHSESTATIGGPGGDIRIDAGMFSLSHDALISVASFGSGAGGNLRVNVGSLAITRGGLIAADNTGSGNGGSIDIRATGSILIQGRLGDATGIQGITQAPQTAGRAGNINLTVKSLELRDNGYIVSGTTGSGNGGLISVSAGSLSLQSGSIIGNSAINGSTGNGGNISIRAGALTIADGSLVSAATQGDGNGGSLDVRADRIDIRGNFSGTTGMFTGAGFGSTGRAGDITIRRSGTISLQDFGLISVQTDSIGKGGNLSIASRAINVDAGSGLLALTTAPVDGGPAGNMRLSAGRLSVRGGSAIAAGSFGSGAGGIATVDAGTIFMRGLDTDTPTISFTLIGAGSNGSGAGGDLNVNAGAIHLENGAAIAVGTNGSGHGGIATINARHILLDRAGIGANSLGLSPDAPPATGDAGSLFVHASKALSLRNGALVGATAEAANGGSVTIASPRITVLNSTISVQAAKTGGDVIVQSDNLLYLFKGQINARGNLALGEINIDPQFTILDHSNILTTTNLGAGGNINVSTDRLFESLDSAISAARGASVTLSIFAPDANISGALVPVNARLFDSSTNFAEECTRQLQTTISSFVIKGRGATPLEPGGLIPALRISAGETPAPQTKTGAERINQKSRMDHGR